MLLQEIYGTEVGSLGYKLGANTAEGMRLDVEKQYKKQKKQSWGFGIAAEGKMSEEPKIIGISTNLFDEVEIHENCTVQILRNSVTGEISVGWLENDNPPFGMEEKQ